MRVFITGATGLIGSKLVAALLVQGHAVLCVSRDAARARAMFPAEVEVIGADTRLPGVWQKRAALCDAVVNLAGEPVAAGRWTSRTRRAIRRSRLDTTGHLATALAKVEHPVTFVSASAVGYYGNRGDEALGEDAQPGDDFLARLAVEWEHTALQAEAEAVRIVQLRIGVVLDAAGGALGRMLPVFRGGLGGPLGSGRQFVPWIHHRDLTAAILFILEHPEVAGPVNAAVPEPVRQRDFARALGRAVGKPAVLPTPGWVLRLMLGEMAGMILGGQRVVPRVLRAHGFTFAYPDLKDALADLLGSGA